MGVPLPHGLGVGQQGVLLLPGEVGGHLHLDGDNQIPPAPAADAGRALAPEGDPAPRLGARRKAVLDGPVDALDLDLAPQRCLGEAHRMDGVQVRAVPLEPGVRGDRHHHQQIPGGAAVEAAVALAPHGDGLAVVDARGHPHLDLPLAAELARPPAVGAGLVDDLSGTPAVGAGGLGGEGEAAHPPLHPDLPRAPALAAHLGGGALGAAGAPAGVAALQPGEGQLLGAARHSLREGDGDAGPEGGAPLGGVGVGPPGAAEAPAEEGAEDVPQVDVAHVEAAEAAPAEVGIHPGVAKLVVLGPLVLVGQHLVGLVDLLELGLRLGVARVHVRVVLLGQLAVGFFQLVVGRGFRHAQYLIVISFLICHIWNHLVTRERRGTRPRCFP